MARLLRAALTSLVTFAALVFVLASIEGIFDTPLETRNLLGVFIALSSAIAAGALGAWQATVDGHRVGRWGVLAAIAPPTALAVALAMLSRAPTDINVMVAVAATLGAVLGVYLHGVIRA
ncbi:MAG TPA: hypothetical protein VGW11_10520 [Solirubrobacteraceae bacterium]|nr:hypothetical protein [Solirubrobacteraceae bacterium]